MAVYLFGNTDFPAIGPIGLQDTKGYKNHRQCLTLHRNSENSKK